MNSQKLTSLLVLGASLFMLGGKSALAQTVPAPAATPTPASSPFSYSGSIRMYYFTRSNLIQNSGNPNRSAFNIGGKLHADYHFGDSPFTLGATYYGATPFGANGTSPQFKGSVDNTLPGFDLNTLGEAYLQYKTKAVYAKLGNQVINTPWANASDSRIKPVAFQGIDTSFQVNPNFSIGLTRMIQFEGRTSSIFDKSTLLTSRPAGNPAYPIFSTNGFFLANATYKNQRTTVSANNYNLFDIGNLLYLEGKYQLSLPSPLKPYIAAQYATQKQSGRALVGIINNNTFGAQIGASLGKNVDLAGSFDTSPWRSADIAASSCAKAGSGYFLPTGGTSDCKSLGGGIYRIYYGGIASPYTEAYATDPIYDTSISQGMVDRHSAGTGYKLAATFQTNNKRIKAILSRAFYDYGNGAGPNKTYETDVDVSYFFNKVGKGTYRGLSLRHRYAERSQPTLPFDFKYNRTQLEYDF